MPTESAARFATLLRVQGLLAAAQLREVDNALLARFPRTKLLVEELVRRGWLTPYQVGKLARGRGANLALGPYVILDRIGRGAMGKVYKVRHRRLGRLAAVKVIRRTRLATPHAAERFRREVLAAAQLSHPNTVRAYDADWFGGAYALVMEYVEGTDLQALVDRRGPLPVARACDYVRQAALGLQHAFEKGLVHRDVKPSNLLLARDGRRVKLTDFGLTRLCGGADEADPLTRQGAILGTPDYVAPEQIADPHAADVRADLYSLGGTLYYLLTGQPPFPGGGALAKLLRHASEEPRPVEELRAETPPAVAAVVRRLLAKRPEDRYPTPADVAAALSAVEPAVAATADGGLAQTCADLRETAGPSTVPELTCGAGTFALVEPGALAGLSRRAAGRAGVRAYWYAGLAAGAGVLLALSAALLGRFL